MQQVRRGITKWLRRSCHPTLELNLDSGVWSVLEPHFLGYRTTLQRYIVPGPPDLYILWSWHILGSRQSRDWRLDPNTSKILSYLLPEVGGRCNHHQFPSRWKSER